MITVIAEDMYRHCHTWVLYCIVLYYVLCSVVCFFVLLLLYVPFIFQVANSSMAHLAGNRGKNRQKLFHPNQWYVTNSNSTNNNNNNQ